MNVSCHRVITLKLLDLYPDCQTVVEFMWGYVIPILAVVIIIVNGLIVSVLSKPHVRSHTTLVLTFIACSDTLNIVFPSISYIHHYTSGRFKDFLSYSSCFWTYILGEVFVDMFNMISLWFTVLLAYMRCRCLRSPFKTQIIHSYKYILIYVAVILVLALVVHLPAFFLFEFSPVILKDNTNLTKVVCGISESYYSLFKPCFGRKLHVLMKTVIDSVLPCVILVSCNICILSTLRRAKKKRLLLRRYSLTSRNERKLHANELLNALAPENDIMLNDVTETEVSPNSENNKGFRPVFRLGRIESKSGLHSRTDSMDQNTRLFNGHFRAGRDNHRKNFKRRNSEFAKVDRESQRTTWLILIISLMILLHEIPIVVTNINNLVIHAGDQLPLNFYGCFSIVLSVWQFITYPVIFVIYAFMSGTFRKELKNTVTSSCKQKCSSTAEQSTLFMCPCSVRRKLSRERSIGDKAEFSYEFDVDL